MPTAAGVGAADLGVLLGRAVSALSGVKLGRAALAAAAPTAGAFGLDSHSLGGFVQSLDQ